MCAAGSPDRPRGRPPAQPSIVAGGRKRGHVSAVETAEKPRIARRMIEQALGLVSGDDLTD